MINTAFAKPPTKNRHHDEMRMFISKLDLSEEQSAQIKAIKAASKEQIKALKGEREEGSKEELESLFTAPTFDEQAFLDLQSKKSEKMNQAALIMAKAKHATYQVLTEEQKQKYAQLKQQHRAKRQEKMANKKNKQANTKSNN
ncbi:Spy/CpxP family protein refolding chaperone [Thalassomonas sp. M1454]|uniref:Spy/CpxP family protein refolding chaperone n=1 Tax=Thalassomonas sp. M1454 TaxID=2594477 RepID=UPI00163DD9D0|nr:Spy/CpxP family protein refolding chaperone [Thalassomonas sp. M1454]